MIRDTIKELLKRQRLLEEALQRQSLPRQEVVESVVQKQHLSEVRSLLAGLAPAEIAEIIDELNPEDLFLVWGEIDEGLLDEILDEVSDATRDTLASRSSYLGAACVVNAFELSQGRLCQTTIESVDDLEGIKPIWVDLVGTTAADRRKIGQFFGLELPDPEDLCDIESSARFYVEEGGEIHLHSDFLLDREGDSRNVPVAFILFRDILFSVREEELPVFRLQRLRARIQTGYVSDGMDMLLDLYAANAEYSADSLEEIYSALGEVGKKVLSEAMTDEEAAKILAEIAEEEDLNGRIRRNILDTRRALTFLIRRKLLSTPQFEDARQIMRDIESLDGHTAFLFDKINFLMDATVGFININQNRVIYRLTVLTVIFMPLNLVAGIGGMSEFSVVTQAIPWPISYGLFTIGLIVMAWLTLVILRFYERRPGPAKSTGEKRSRWLPSLRSSPPS
ncbi:magnesium and cobalt transport protein CorA [Pelobacter propionicus]|uniref:Mg2+ transporter protein, CorA family protein n=1 Tax=Pelobacter propionicus (strain DSM 2379 / NBRC 103807 / OttBd1) TaxID=338966 RepID=A1ATA7_PELPD|nr:magnesium and cobalt transport protein CorA [Pelobacter propionicus]ABL00578.1 Mg2+ transporter protein, CorA family protein [Pelobacter propionicus DSM 2379]